MKTSQSYQRKNVLPHFLSSDSWLNCGVKVKSPQIVAANYSKKDITIERKETTQDKLNECNMNRNFTGLSLNA